MHVLPVHNTQCLIESVMHPPLLVYRIVLLRAVERHEVPVPLRNVVQRSNDFGEVAVLDKLKKNLFDGGVFVAVH